MNNLVFKNKNDFYAIPYWDRVKLESIDLNTLQSEHLRAHTIDRTHYVLSQVTHTGTSYLYELLYVTVVGCVDRNHYHHKIYRPLVEVYFDA